MRASTACRRGRGLDDVRAVRARIARHRVDEVARCEAEDGCDVAPRRAGRSERHGVRGVGGVVRDEHDPRAQALRRTEEGGGRNGGELGVGGARRRAGPREAFGNRVGAERIADCERERLVVAHGLVELPRSARVQLRQHRLHDCGQSGDGANGVVGLHGDGLVVWSQRVRVHGAVESALERRVCGVLSAPGRAG